MKLQILRFPLIIAVLSLIVVVSDSIAQPDYVVVALTARDATSGIGTITFGTHVNGTYCGDDTLNPGGFIEELLPPKPPGGVFDFRFTESRSGSNCLDQGLSVHLQQGAPKIDTFKIDFQPCDGNYPFTFSWPAQNPADWPGGLTMKDPFGGIIVNVNMLTDTTAVVSNSAITTLNIVGGSVALTVEREGDLIPGRFALQQNYPNPFNPSTTL